MNMERRELLKVIGLVAASAVSGIVLPETVRAEGEWMPQWGFWKINIPAAVSGAKDERVPFHLATAEGNTAVITCGPFSYIDPFGVEVNLLGGVNRASVAIIKGPVGAAHKGKEVNPLVVPVFNWVGVTPNPEGGLEQEHLETIIRERESSLRSPQGGNFSGSQIDVVVIDGKTGAVSETRTVYPKR